MLCDGYTALGQPPVAGVLGLKARFRHFVPAGVLVEAGCQGIDSQHQFQQKLGSKIGEDG
jgi:hypothetical protein